MYHTQNDDFNVGETSPSKENVKFEYKKDILSIARRLLIYFVIFFFFSLLGRSVLRQMQLDSKYYYLLMDTSFVYTITAVFLYIGAFIGLIAWVVKTKFPFKRIFEHVAPKKMTVGTFFLMSGSIFGIRFVSKFILMGIDKLFTQMGIPVSLLGDASPEITSSIVFVLYIGLVAPFVEEVIFRGFIGYRMERYGKIFAIGFSAMIFSLFHANLSQEIFTFFLGILLAYIAFEYGFQWAVAFHMINNFIFAIIVDIYISPAIVIERYPLHSILELLGFILLIYILFTKLPEIKAYISENHAFKGIGFITFTKWQIVLYILVILYYSVGIYFIPRGF